MKDTGMVRRIDELGRIVIPKEIRRTMHLKEGTPVQIFVNSNGELTLTKYSAIVDVSLVAQTFCDVVSEVIDNNILIFDKDKVVASTYKIKELRNKEISAQLEDLLEERKSYFFSKNENSKMITLFKNDDNIYNSLIIVPILVNSDIVGGIVAFEIESNNLSVSDVKILQTISKYIEKQVE